jgi:hypothetical protein
MMEIDQVKPDRILDPLERSSEIMFGLIMALTFTCTVSVAASKIDVRTMLVSALGCNVAWGFIDAAMYVLAQMVSRQRRRLFAVEISQASPLAAREMLLEKLPDGLDQQLSGAELDTLVKGIKALSPPAQILNPPRDDIVGAVGIFLLVFLSTFPVALPFLIINDVSTALRTSNAIAIALLFLVGTQLGRYMGWRSPKIFGFGVALFGSALVAIAVALGG